LQIFDFRLLIENRLRGGFLFVISAVVEIRQKDSS